jgi:hypothetical protein
MMSIGAPTARVWEPVPAWIGIWPRPPLAAALFASVLLHLLGLFFALGLPAGSAGGDGQRLLRVTLVERVAPVERQQPTATAEPVPAPAAAVAAERKGKDGDPQTSRPRFAAAPDFSAVEGVALSGPAVLRLRVHVSSRGRAGAIDVLEARNVPPDFLVAVSDELQRAHYLPGRLGGLLVAGDFEIEVKAEPAAGTGIMEGPGQ